ncbi:MAG: S-methyl-5'-thioadenosine phosphorylase [Desulfobacula sp.]|nr:S-methyl-5'-thioadenosine phosphorylase [Desulfobacula sp.]
MSDIKIGVIGGSGIYQMDGVTHIEEIKISTPFGSPSDTFMVGELNKTKIAFLPRHGRNHSLLPSELNYRANIFGFKKLGVTHLIAITAVGSLKQEIPPLDILIPDQLVDRTFKRESTFFGNGIVAHIPFAKPFCPDLSDLLFKTASSATDRVHKGGTLITIEGPAFSTKAESKLYQKWGVDIIGMTTLQEAKMAREAEICYAAMAMVTDYDCWKEDIKEVSVETVISNLTKNASLAKTIITDLVGKISKNRECICADSLKGAIMTKADSLDDDTYHKLLPLIGKYLHKQL